MPVVGQCVTGLLMLTLSLRIVLTGESKITATDDLTGAVSSLSD